ncbi:hypothetical protein EYR40_007442 [Pleurotus pulmonarius]|nr:hypothetical protein EYR38_008257 [Pleurotus pulmonarius]KAF4596992.1 hypothetical protein EYR40_007442 [Pleurotus pulmonarius]
MEPLPYRRQEGLTSMETFMSNEHKNKNSGPAVGGAPTIGNAMGREPDPGDQHGHDAGNGVGREVANHPPEHDTTSDGGYGSAEVWSDGVQRGNAESAMTGNQTSSGLIDQSLNGTNLKSELADAKQGVDEDTRREMEPLSPYGKSSLDSNSDARQHLADAFSN